jgi:hypothetical protein
LGSPPDFNNPLTPAGCHVPISLIVLRRFVKRWLSRESEESRSFRRY